MNASPRLVAYVCGSTPVANRTIREIIHISLLFGAAIISVDTARAQVSSAFTGSAANSQTIECFPRPFGLVGWWPGDGNANDIQGTNHGLLQNGTTFLPGLVGQGFNFDGLDDFVRIADAPELRPVQFTLEAWVYP